MNWKKCEECGSRWLGGGLCPKCNNLKKKANK